MRKRKTTNEFISKANKVHTNKYGYNKTVYTINREPVIITCKVHGDFSMMANAHTNGQGCPSCRYATMADSRRGTTIDFITRANLIHNNKYAYESTKYINSRSKLIVTCKKHGDFEQIANDHLAGSGCPHCGAESCNTWSYSDWESAGLKSTAFDSFKFYIIRLYNDEESFIKVGKTYRKLSDRFAVGQSPYKYEILKTVEGGAEFISQLERSVLNSNAVSYYKPEISFGGCTECFSKVTFTKVDYYG